MNRWPASASTHGNCSRPRENSSTGGAWVCGTLSSSATIGAVWARTSTAGLVGVEEQLHRQRPGLAADVLHRRRVQPGDRRPPRTWLPWSSLSSSGLYMTAVTAPGRRVDDHRPWPARCSCRRRGGAAARSGLATSAPALEVGAQLAHAARSISSRRSAARSSGCGPRRPAGPGRRSALMACTDCSAGGAAAAARPARPAAGGRAAAGTHCSVAVARRAGPPEAAGRRRAPGRAGGVTSRASTASASALLARRRPAPVARRQAAPGRSSAVHVGGLVGEQGEPLLGRRAGSGRPGSGRRCPTVTASARCARATASAAGVGVHPDDVGRRTRDVAQPAADGRRQTGRPQRRRQPAGADLASAGRPVSVGRIGSGAGSGSFGSSPSRRADSRAAPRRGRSGPAARSSRPPGRRTTRSGPAHGKVTATGRPANRACASRRSPRVAGVVDAGRPSDSAVVRVVSPSSVRLGHRAPPTARAARWSRPSTSVRVQWTCRPRKATSWWTRSTG